MKWGHGKGRRVVLAQRKPERERGWRVRVGEEEEERARRKAGKAAGMDGDRTGDLKGKATPRSAPGHPGGSGGAGVGWAEPGVAAGGGDGAGYQDAQHSSCRDAGCGITPHPAASSCSRGGKPRHGSRIQPRTPSSCQFEEGKGNWLLCSIELLGSLPF